MQARRIHGVRCATVAGGLLVGLLCFWLALVSPAYADTIVSTCTSAGLDAALSGPNGTITFDCGAAPVVITVTHNGGAQVPNTKKFTIDGGDKVTLNGAHTNRLFDVRVGGALTLSHIILTDGYQDAVHGNLPDLGGAILAEGLSLTLDHVTIRNSQSQTGGGGIEIITGTVIIKDSLIEGNQTGIGGGGIDNANSVSLTSTLSLLNSTVRNNHVLLSGGGGGLNVKGVVAISNSQITDNSTQGASPGGGVRIDSSGQVSIMGSQLLGNRSSSDGGGIWNGGVLTLMQCVVSGNLASWGAGLFTQNNATVDSSFFLDNQANGNGGGIFNEALLTLSNSTVRGNGAVGDGGGLSNHGGATLFNVVLSDNTSSSTGGGISNGGSEPLSLYRSTVSGNAASDGGGIYNKGYLTVDQSTLSHNIARNGMGGGLYNNEVATLQNTTLSGNVAASNGGGIYSEYVVSLLNATISDNSAATGGGLFNLSGKTAVLTNTILAYSSSGGNCSGTLTASKFTLSSDNSCALPPANTIHGLDPNGLDPLLTALGNYGGLLAGAEPTPILVHMLKPGSPAIAGIVGNDAPNVDERDLPRPEADGSYDVGAVEKQGDETTLAPHLYLPALRR